MIRLHFLVEGPTEEGFVSSVLAEHLGYFDISTDARSVLTSRDRTKNINYRGGMSTYQKAKRDLERWMKEDANSNSFFTTRFDLYALPKDFPEFDKANIQSDSYQKVATLEDAFVADLAQGFNLNVDRLLMSGHIS
jgi:hypothetical protein